MAEENRKSIMELLEEDMGAFDAPATEWEMFSRGAWVLAPFKLPARVTPGKKGRFPFGGMTCELEFTAPTEGIVRAKEREYPCRVKEYDFFALLQDFVPEDSSNTANEPSSVIAASRKSVIEQLEADMGAFEDTAPVDWEIETRGTWSTAPFQLPRRVVSGKRGRFYFSGMRCELHFTSNTSGVVCAKGREYPCHVKAQEETQEEYDFFALLQDMASEASSTEPKVIEASRKTVIQQLEAEMGSFEDAAPVDWEIQTRGAWSVAPFQLPMRVIPGKTGKFYHGGMECELHFTSTTNGVVCAKGREYPCRVKETWAPTEEEQEYDSFAMLEGFVPEDQDNTMNEPAVIEASRKSVIEQLEAEMGAFEDAAPVDWEMETRGAWVVAPFQLPKRVIPGKSGKFYYAGMKCELHFTTQNSGVVCAKGREYPCRVKGCV